MSHPLTLTVSDPQRRALEDGRDHDPRPSFRERCAALLKIADGEKIPAIAAHGLLVRRQRETLYRWLRAYLATGLDGLAMRPRGHRGAPP